jgi:type VI secretion system protein ImpL
MKAWTWLLLSPRNLLILLVVIALVLLTWFAGPLLEVGLDRPLAPVSARVLVIVCILVLVIVIALIGYWRVVLSRRQLLADLAKAERLSQKERAPVAEVSLELREDFERSLRALYDAFPDKVGARGFARRLPWYAVIGTAGSGKTAMLRRSGLPFVLSPAMPQETTSSASSLDWWVTDEAALLEVAGGYLLPPGAADHLPGWHGLLSLVKEHRPRRPLNGIILVVSLQELLTLSAVDRKASAATVRARLQEMLSAFGVRLPVYVILSKADWVSGFTESFEGLPETARDAIWGGSLPLEIDFQDARSEAVLNDLFASLIDERTRQRNDRLRTEHDVSQRQRIFGFPEQLATVLPLVTEAARSIFRASRFETKPLLRGIFLTSATQNSQAVDVATRRNTTGMQFVAPTLVAAESGDTSYFIQEVFTRFVFPENGLADFDPRLERRRTIRSLAGIGVAAAIVILFAVIWSFSTVLAEDRLTRVKADALDLISTNRTALTDTSWERQLRALDLSQAIGAEYEDEIGILFGQAGLAGGRQARSVAIRLYKHTLLRQLLPRILAELEGNINRSLAASDTPEILKALTVYLMLGDPKHFDAATVTRWIDHDWQTNYLMLPPTEQRLDSHLAALLSILPRNVDLDENLIQAARQAVVQLPTADSAYAQLEAQAAADASLPPFQRGVALGASAPLSLSAGGVAGLNTQIPGFYTRQGFNAYILRKLPQNAQALSQDNWVLGPSPLASSGSASDLLDQVAKLYSADYIGYWDNAIRGLQLRQAPDLTTAIDALAGLAGPDSPLSRLVSAIAANTNLTPPQGASTSLSGLVAKPSLGAAANAAQDALSKWNGFSTWPGATIQAHFAPIIALDGGAGSDSGAGAAAGAAPSAAAPGGTPMDQVRGLVAGAYSVLQGVAAAPNPQFAALNLLKAQENGSVGDALSPLLTQASAYPTPIGSLLRQIAASTSSILADLAGQYIALSWRQAGGTMCQSRIDGRYPVNPASSQDIAMADFQSFFGPSGVMDTFYTTMIEPLGLAVGGDNGGGSVFRIDPRTIASFQKARRIRDAFFRDGRLSIPLGLTPVRLDPAALSDVLTIGGQQYTYQHEPPRRWQINWPAANGDPSVSFSITDLKGRSYDMAYSGDWALFRFITSGMTTGAPGASTYTVSLALSGLTGTYSLSTDSLQSAFDPTTVYGFACPVID